MKFVDKNKCGAWRCEDFSCMNSSDNCDNTMCHVCSNGHSCQYCDNAPDCKDFLHNIKMQNGD